MKKKYDFLLRVIPGLIAATYAGSALSQSQVEEVIVTVQKRQEKLQEVPLSITAISGAQLETRGIEGLANLNALAPNLTVRTNVSELISTVSLRGSSSGQPGIWVDPPVGMYVDGIYVGKSAGSVFDVVEMERVEVLRGPQGMLFGRNTEGGAVNMISRRPSGVWGGSASLEVGNRNHAVERIALDLPKMGIASISIGARKENSDGWAKNASGPDLGAKDKEAFRLAATLDFSKDFKLDYTYDKSDINNTPPVTSLRALSGWRGSLKDFWLPYAPYIGGIDVATALGNAQSNAMLPYVRTSRPSEVALNVPGGPYERSDIVGNALTFNYRLSDQNSLKYIYAKRDMKHNELQDIDGTPVSSVEVFPGFNWPMSMNYDGNTSYSQTSHELQWIGNTDRMKYVFGAYLFKDDGTARSNQEFGLFGEDPLRADYGTQTDAKAIFGQIDYTVTDQLTASVGMRRTEEEKRGWTHRFYTNGFGGTPTPGGDIVPRTDYSQSFAGNTPMVALAYKLDETTNLYGRIAEGWKSGGFNSDVGELAAISAYKPQTSTSVEFGIKKMMLNNRAQINVAVFQNKISDQQLTRLMPGTTQSVLINAGQSTYRGFELEGALVPADGWKLQAGYGYLKADFDSFMDDALNIPGQPIIETASNKETPFAPKHTLSLNVDGRLAKTQWGTLRGILDYTYTTKLYSGACNKDITAANAGGNYSCPLVEMPSTQMINARLLLAGIPVGGPGAADLSLWVKNLTNENQQVNGIDFGMMRTANWQPPRTFGMSFNYKW